MANDARAGYLHSRGFTNLVAVDDEREIPQRLGNDLDLWVTQALRAPQTAGVDDLKLVFGAILVQDYYLACGLKVPGPTVEKLSEALREMTRDGTARRLVCGSVF